MTRTKTHRRVSCLKIRLLSRFGVNRFIATLDLFEIEA
jgi:hypothetical protein